MANSALSPTLHDVFFYPRWLQTSPPLFLLLVRATVRVFGTGNAAFRAVPLAMGALSAILMWCAASKILRRPYAILAWTMFVASPAAFEYSLTLKQYSSDVAASTALLLAGWNYLRHPTRGRFLLLCGAVAVGILLSYSLVFALPFAVLLLLARRAYARTIVTALLGAGIFLWEYLALISKNASPVLQAFWTPDYFHNALLSGMDLLWLLPLPDRFLLHSKMVGCAAGALVLAGLALACSRRGRWLEVQAFCGGPCLLVCMANYFSLYPMTARTELFLLPFLVVLLIADLQLVAVYLLRVDWVRRRSLAVILIAASVVLVAGARRIESYSRTLPEEDTASAVAFLRDDVRSEDVLWVHASASEPFRLYAQVLNWTDPPTVYGNTGWPCCPRGVAALKNSSTEAAVRRDFDSTISSDRRGKIWLLHTTRPAHWAFVGLNEAEMVKDLLRERGCTEGATPAFSGVGVSAFDCSLASNAPALDARSAIFRRAAGAASSTPAGRRARFPGTSAEYSPAR